jgi:DUF1009 family protein
LHAVDLFERLHCSSDAAIRAYHVVADLLDDESFSRAVVKIAALLRREQPETLLTFFGGYITTRALDFATAHRLITELCSAAILAQGEDIAEGVISECPLLGLGVFLDS